MPGNVDLWIHASYLSLMPRWAMVRPFPQSRPSHDCVDARGTIVTAAKPKVRLFMNVSYGLSIAQAVSLAM